ncbi:phosphotransferase family protein [Sphingobium sp. HBC34]|uniref:Phosphotransferase family protein n=1 Tax=Sphingobium cyanobacteriorum TaxID=3063954 RepID=A0ABT8ZPK8_9SPHN|nr:phosphotransferase family protein [Sphingobium sp. HBC34]MDO7835451.1 phosphotransferase family protein [Sphingobium sp. HBC34]
MSKNTLQGTAGHAVAAAKKRFSPIEASAIHRLLSAQRGVSAVSLSDVETLADGAGASNGITFFKAQYVEDGVERSGEFVLRYEAGEKLFKQNRFSAEFHTLSAVAKRGLPVPFPVWIDEAGQILGRSGYILERLHGDAPKAAIYSQGPLASVSPATRHDMMLQAADFIAALAVAGLDAEDVPHLAARGGDGHPIDNDLNWWMTEVSGVTDSALVLDGLLVRAATKLSDRKPADAPIVLVHGDTNFGNMMYGENRFRAMLDWELSRLGHSELDLAFTIFCSEIFQIMDKQVEGVPSEQDFIARFEAQAGRSVTHWDYHKAYVRFTSACVSVLLADVMGPTLARSVAELHTDLLSRALARI